jgi:hypothetical protein
MAIAPQFSVILENLTDYRESDRKTGLWQVRDFAKLR